MSDAASKKETAEAKKARQQREEQELHEKRNLQLADAKKAVDKLNELLRTTRSTIKLCDALLNHSKGFYEEVNKLTKGKAMLEVTDLVVVQANDIIRDAKNIVKEDVHLERIKEFVPAGTNPVYPDVLVSIRSVRDSLERCNDELDARLNTFRERLLKAKTVIGALQYFLNDENDENDRNYPSKNDVEEYVNGKLSDSCFFWDKDAGEWYFDFYSLDGQTIQEYLSANETDEGGDARADDPDDSNEADPGDEDGGDQDEAEDNEA
jgi:hypothetical protein